MANGEWRIIALSVIDYAASPRKPPSSFTESVIKKPQAQAAALATV
jgi:hypothetical protein